MKKLYPLLLEPIYKKALWGGQNIFTHFHREKTQDSCSESWEITDREEGVSLITNGFLKGKSLHEALLTYKERLVGKNKSFDKFPLLIKLIDANRKLSLQVHPDDHLAAEMNEEAKTECWVILKTKDPSYIYANFKEKVTPEIFKKALLEKRVDDLVLTKQVKKDDLIYIPGRTIHAIGEGCLILEVQQSSNTTFRVYDWDREDVSGNKRELHIEESLKTIDFSKIEDPLVNPSVIEETKGYTLLKLLSTPFFSLERLEVRSVFTKSYNEHSFHVFFCLEGKALITAGDYSETLLPGMTILVPAELDAIEIKQIEKPCRLIRIFL